MRDHGHDGGTGGGAGASVGLPSVEQVQGWIGQLGGAGSDLTDAQRIDLLRSLEVLKCAAEGAQAELAVDFDSSQRRVAAGHGVRAERQGRGVAAQVALARRESPHRGQIHLGTAKILRREMPCTYAALRAGRISEWRATILVRETACLELPSRTQIDQQLAGDADRLEQMGDGELTGEIRKLAYRLEPRSFAERRKKAEADRHTRLRPAPDTMAIFTALLSVRNGVAVHAVLGREADRLRAAGDTRTRGQLMADLLVHRVTQPHAGSAAVDADTPSTSSSLGVMVNLVVPDDVLLGDSDAGGHVDGYGPVPGDLLREWIADLADEQDADDVRIWLRRVYRRPRAGDLVAMDSTARRFVGKLAEFLRLRDQRCRTPWCDAPIRHLDHAEDVADGGPTSAANGQGLCEACNHAKQVRDWLARYRNAPDDDHAPHTIDTVTPTGHTVTSTAPSVGPRPRAVAADLFFPLTVVA